MDTPSTVICPACRAVVPVDSFFCPNCGKPLREKPLQTTIWKQIGVYFVSLFLPPFGLWYVWKYLRSGDSKAREIGIVALVLTVISIAVTIWTAVALGNSVNQTLNQQRGSYNGLLGL